MTHLESEIISCFEIYFEENDDKSRFLILQMKIKYSNMWKDIKILSRPCLRFEVLISIFLLLGENTISKLHKMQKIYPKQIRVFAVN